MTVTRNFFIKFNLDDMRHDMDRCKGEHDEWLWFRGFRAGAAGVEPVSPPGPQRDGEEFGYQAWQEANAFRESRKVNAEKRWTKKKGLQTSKEEASSIQHPTTSVASAMHQSSICIDDARASTHERHMSPHMSSDMHTSVEGTGVSTPDPPPQKPKHMERFERQYKPIAERFLAEQEARAAALRASLRKKA